MSEKEEPATLRSDETQDERGQTKLVLRSVLPGQALAVELTEERRLLGRDEDCSVRLQCDGVSRQHAEICRRGPVLSIRDLGSTNGTYVGGQRVEHAPLERGTVIRLGEWLGVVEEHPADDPGPYHFREVAPGLWGGAELARAVRRLLSAASSNVPVLLVGRTGAGKERFALALHDRGGATRSFHAINCAALAPALAEAELFGYRKGAFTGADRSYAGHLKAAHGGTLFLDEIADLSLPLQAKLLRALDTGELIPLGETQPTIFRAHLVAACQVPLTELVRGGGFREDLAARLSGVVVTLPELAQRCADVPALFQHFLVLHSGGTAPAVSSRFYECLCLHAWPGNVRELEMLARQLLAVHGLEPVLRQSHLPEELRRARQASDPDPGERPRNEADKDAEVLARALKGAGGNVKRAAKLAGISRQKAYRLIGSRRLAPLVSASRGSAAERKNESEQ